MYIIVLPWCRLDKTYCVGKVTMRPVCPGAALPQHLSRVAAKAFEVFRDFDGKPLSEIVLVDNPWDSGADRESDDAVEVACFSALANRDFELFADTPQQLCTNYCNADIFRRFCVEIDGSARRVSSGIRRRDGVSVMRNILTAYAPLETGLNAGPVRLDEVPLVALAHFWGVNAGNGEWRRVRDSIDYFNQANTDSPLLTRRAGWVLLSGAFQRFLGPANFALSGPEKTRKCFEESLKKCGVSGATSKILADWLKQFCELRGDAAHGNRHSPKNSNWALRHHLLIAVLAFPLLVELCVQSLGTDKAFEAVTRVCALAQLARQTKQEPKNTLCLLATKIFPGPKTWTQFLAECQKA